MERSLISFTKSLSIKARSGFPFPTHKTHAILYFLLRFRGNLFMDIDTCYIETLEELNTGNPSVLLSKGITNINSRSFPAHSKIHILSRTV
jgi:hypothetical protein